MKRFVLALVWAALLVLAAADFGHAAEVTTTWGYGGSDYNWGTGGNWDLGVPNNGADEYIAEIYDADTIAVNGQFTVNTLNNYAGTVDIGSNKWLKLMAGTSTNDGTIRLNDTTTGYAILYMDGDVTLGGTGSVEFISAGQNEIWADSGGGTLTVGAGQTIRAVAGTSGAIKVGTTNQGKIEANGGTVTLNTSNKVNQNIIQAIGGGTLNITGITLDNTAGTLTAGTGSTINLSGAIIQGGISGDGDVTVTSPSTIDGSGVGGATLAPAITTGSSDFLDLKGDIVNNGEIRLNDTTTGYAILYMDGAVNLGGTGSVEFISAGQNEIRADAVNGGTLNVGVDQTIRAGAGTSGVIKVGTTNQGKIEANGGTVTLNTSNKFNQNIIQAIGGGTLNITGITLDNTAGTLTAGAGSTINLSTATIQGGISGTGDVNVTAISTIDGTAPGGSTLTPVITTNNYKYLHLAGDIFNNGQIRVNDIGTGSAILYMDGDVNLGGDGSVEFISGGSNEIRADTGGGTLTVGADQTIRAGAGTAGKVNVGMTNQGLISADGGTLTLNTSDKVNQGDIEAVNSGTLDITGIILDNTAGTLSVDDVSTINLSGATIQGGISGTGNVNLTAQSTIDGTAPGGATLTPVITTSNYKYLHLAGDIFNNGQIRVNDIGTGSAIMYMDGAVNLGGTGSVEFTTNGGNYINADTGGGTMTVGADQTIRAGAGTKGYINVQTINHGTIEADGGTLDLPNLLTNNGLVRSAQGSTLAVDNSVGGTGGWQADGGTLDVNDNVSTSGDINVRNSGTLDLAASQTMTGRDLSLDGTLNVGDGATLALTGNLGFAMTDESLWNFGAGSSLLMNGGSGYQALEIGGEDLGFDAAGFSDNFDLDVFGLQGSGTFAYLSDALDNGNRHSPEALYVDDLEVLVDTILNLNGLSLYTYLDDQIYLVQAGDGDLFGGGQIVDFDQPASAVPVPGAVWLLGSGLLGLMGLRRKFK